MSDPVAEKEQGPPVQNDNSPNPSTPNNGEPEVEKKKKREYKEFGHDEVDKPLREYNFPFNFSISAFGAFCDLVIVV